MSSKQRHVGRQGDIVRVRELGPIKANDGHDLIAIFLGACAQGEEPDAAGFLKQLGWARTHVFELSLLWKSGEVSRQMFAADSPQEAAEAAIRAALFARDALADVDQLRALQLRLMRLGPISPEGKPHNGRGKVFFAWAEESGRPLDQSLLLSEPAPPADG